MLKSPFNKVAGLKVCNFIKKQTPTQVLPLNIAKYLGTAFLIEQLQWLLLPLFHAAGLFVYP